MWGDTQTVSFSCGSRDVIRVRATRQGFAHRCKRCSGLHPVHVGQGGEYLIPWWVSGSCLKERGRPHVDFETCPYRWCGCLMPTNRQCLTLRPRG